MTDIKLSRLLLLEEIRRISFRDKDISNKLIEYIYEKSNLSAATLEKEVQSTIEKSTKKFLSHVFERYQKVNRHYDFFLNKYEKWLEGDFLINISKDNSSSNDLNIKKRGRPHLQYENMSIRSKRRASSKLSAQISTEQLLSASLRSVRGDANHKNVSKQLRKTQEAFFNEHNENNIDDLNQTEQTNTYSNSEALALILDCDLSVNAYKTLRTSATQKNTSLKSLYPTYNDVLNEKHNCYPENMRFTETKAECQMKSLLEHTASRLLKINFDKIESNAHQGETSTYNGIFQCKWGFDGASGQSIYKQKFQTITNENVNNVTEESLFLTSLVPLSLEINDKNVWMNKLPSSSLLCRPIRIQYIKETPDVLREEKQYFLDQINELENITLEVNGIIVSLSLKMEITMLDGKAINALMNTNSTRSCNVCGAKPNEMTHVKPADMSSFMYGISGLHSWIRFFEFILHLGYKLAVKKFIAKSPEEKKLVQERKSSIQASFKSLLSLNVDVPKVGSGNSNDGNTARKAFRNSKVFSDITGVNEDLIIRLHAILQVINCKSYIDVSKFKVHCDQTVALILDLYPWYKFPPSVHKVLFHGHQIISYFNLPIGYYSEEAQESMNKVVRNARLFHARKTSRLDTIEDQMNFLLLRSDPLICSMRKIMRNDQAEEMTKEAQDLILNVDVD